MMVFANILGSIVNKMIAEGFIIIILMIIILIGILINIGNARNKYLEENKRFEELRQNLIQKGFQEGEIKQGQENFGPNQNDEENDLLIPDSDTNGPNLENDPENREISNEESETEKPPKLSEKEQVQLLQKYEGRNFHPKKTSIFVVTILITIVYSLLKGSSSLESIINLEICQKEQLILFGCLLFFIILIQIYSIRIVKNEQRLKIKYNLHRDHEIKFTNKNIIFLVLFALGIGFLANLLGMGGGFVIFPMLVLIKVSPVVASATTIYMIFLSKLVAALLVFFGDYLKIGYTFAECVLVSLSTIVFFKISNIIMKKYL